MKVKVEWIFKEPRIFEAESLETLIKDVVCASDNSWAGSHTVKNVEVIEGETMEVKAYGRKIIIKKLEGASVSPGGIVLPKARHSNWAEIISVGPNADQGLVGLTVLVHDYAGTEIELENGTHFVIEETDIVATKN